MGPADRGLLYACSLEIRAHRVIFLGLLCPMLGILSPSLLVYVSLVILLDLYLNLAGQVSVADFWSPTILWVGVSGVTLTALLGVWRARREVVRTDAKLISEKMQVPQRSMAQLVTRFEAIWRALPVRSSMPTPQLIVQSHLGATAHAYEDSKLGPLVELSSGMARRVTNSDPLAVTLLRHESAHLIFHDLPAIRVQAICAGGALLSAYCALALAVVTTAALTLVADRSAMRWDQAMQLDITILLAALIVSLPLILSIFIVRRYSGFLVALIELRADGCAGLWGEGLTAFSKQIDDDPSIRGSTIADMALAYLSPSLTHFPTSERVALLSNPEGFATPKLRFFMAALLPIWLLQFHQGNEIWDFLLLSVVVASTFSFTIYMVADTPAKYQINAKRALALATGLLLMQALPLISIEALAYIAEDLTFAVSQPGGFSPASGLHYLADTADAFVEVGRSIIAATGGFKSALSVMLLASILWLLARLNLGGDLGTKRLRLLPIALSGFSASLLVSYRFFQESLAHPLRLTVIRISQSLTQSGTSLVPKPIARFFDRLLWDISEFFFGDPIMSHLPWVRLAVPGISVLSVSLVTFAFFKVLPKWRDLV